MPTQLQLRRGSNSDMSSFTGAEGELTVNTTNKSLHLHDGSTSGGIEFARADLSNSTASWTVSDGSNTSTIVVGTDTLTVNGTSNQIDVAVGTDSVTISTPDSGVTAASYGSSTAIPVVTVDAKGRVTAVTTASITSSTPGIVDNSNATAITIGSDESVTLTSTVTTTGITVNTDADSSLSIADSGTNAIIIKAAAGDELYMGANNTYAIRILNDGTNDVVLDNGSNLGIGVSPKAWKTDWHVLNIGPEASFYSHPTATAGIGENIYYSTSNNWTAVTTGPSSIYQLDSGSHNFYTMASVSAGATATPVQRMLIDNAGDTTMSGNGTFAKTGADTVVELKGNSNHDAVLNLRSDQGAITTEGFQVWYDNSVGDVHLGTTYAHDNAAIRFHTRTGTDKVATGTNERLTIRGDGNVEVPDGYLAAKQPAAIAKGQGGWQTSYTAAGWNELHTLCAFTSIANSVGSPWSNSTGRFTAPIAGYYLCSMSIYANNSNPGAHGTSYIHPQWAKNGNVNIHGDTPYQIYGHDATAANSYTDGIGRTDIVYCAAGDYITVQLYMHGANWQIFRNYTAISFCLLSA